MSWRKATWSCRNIEMMVLVAVAVSEPSDCSIGSVKIVAWQPNNCGTSAVYLQSLSRLTAVPEPHDCSAG